jgi:hypothetical protein
MRGIFLEEWKMLCFVLLIGHTASYQPHRACMRRFVTTCCISPHVRSFAGTPTLFCKQISEGPHTAKTLENFTPIMLDRSKKKPKMQTTAVLTRHLAPVDISGYEYDADTDLLFKSEVTGFEDERGNIIDLQDETDEEKRRIIAQLHPQPEEKEVKTDTEEGFLEASTRPSVPEYFQEIFNHQDHDPYHAIGLLHMSYSKHGNLKGDFKYIGSAFLIGEDILMTAGHNLLPSEFKITFKAPST